jgi:hypothetical protein
MMPLNRPGAPFLEAIMKRQALLAFLLGLAASQALACYTVYDRSGRLVYQDERPPVDMSRPLSETLQGRFPGGHMVFDAQADCAAVSPPLPPISARDGAPLLTDRRTAQSMNVPYTVMQGNIVLVQPRHSRIGPGVTVIPADSAALSRSSRGTVITELRDPPLTIVQSENGAVIGGIPGSDPDAMLSSARPAR